MHTEILVIICGTLLILITIAIIVLTLMKGISIIAENSIPKNTSVHNTPKLDISYDQAIKIIDEMVKFNVSSTIIVHGLHDKTPEELSVIMDKHIVDISESIFINMSNPLKNTLMQYMSEDYIKKYIIGLVRLVLVARLTNYE